jgi:cyclase
MLKNRVIPCLLLKDRGFVKTVSFKKPRYLGDPINILKIFNEKEVDEIVILDIAATAEGRKPDFDYLAEITGECFMPLGYGGGITELDDVRRLLGLGFEKVVLNTAAYERPELIEAAAREVGSQSVVVSIDIKKGLLGKHEVWIRGGRKKIDTNPIAYVREMESRGAGEIILNSIDNDGRMCGYDLGFVRSVTATVGIPVVACGGAATVDDLRSVITEGKASAAAAGSMFVFQGPHRAVLISYPSTAELATM